MQVRIDTDARETLVELDLVLSLRELEQVVGLRKTAIYSAIKEHDFPAPIRLTSQRSGWLWSEVQSWLTQRQAERDSESGKAERLERSQTGRKVVGKRWAGQDND